METTEKQKNQKVDFGKRGKRPKSYKSCPYYPTMSKRRIRALPDEKKCKDAVNCRRCKRCLFCPQGKIQLWNEETNRFKQQFIVDIRQVFVNCYIINIVPNVEENFKLILRIKNIVHENAF